jgi:uncharacterized protein YecE (DUF72 family)
MTLPLRVGTAGWGIASRYLDQIPLGGSHLERYARVFNAVEIDSSFNRHHRRSTYARWADSVGGEFSFAVKTPKALTHDGTLVSAENAELEQFLEEISGLGARLGALLVQLPPSLAFDESSVRSFFTHLAGRLPPAVVIACEPRHNSWSAAPANDLLQALGISRVAADPARFGADALPGGDISSAYFRLHGQPRIYYSDYEWECLATLGDALRHAALKSSAVWCMFDNTAHGHAIGNALAIKNMLVDTTR